MAEDRTLVPGGPEGVATAKRPGRSKPIGQEANRRPTLWRAVASRAGTKVRLHRGPRLDLDPKHTCARLAVSSVRMSLRCRGCWA
jgi:hypothetical protein